MKLHNYIRFVIIFLILDNVKMNTIVEFHENISKDSELIVCQGQITSFPSSIFFLCQITPYQNDNNNNNNKNNTKKLIII